MNRITYYSEALLLTKNFTKNLSEAEIKQWQKTSMIVGILSLGIIHAACALIYIVRNFDALKANFISVQKMDPAIVQVAQEPLKLPAPEIKQAEVKADKPKEKEEIPHLDPIEVPVLKIIDDWDDFCGFPAEPAEKKAMEEMTPELKYALFELYGTDRELDHTEYAKLAALFPQKEMLEVLRIEEQNAEEDGFCGLYAINNALQESKLQIDTFSLWHSQFYQRKFKIKPNAADELANDFGKDGMNYGVDPQALMYIIKSALEIKMKMLKIADLIQEKPKQESIQEFLGNSSWAILANIDHSYRFPINGDIHVSPKGHFTALRKDSEGTWWFVDSTAKRPIAIDLFLLPECFTIVVPIV